MLTQPDDPKKAGGFQSIQQFLVFGRSKLTVVWNKSVGYISGLE
jgi:hypothetical protein